MKNIKNLPNLKYEVNQEIYYIQQINQMNCERKCKKCGHIDNTKHSSRELDRITNENSFVIYNKNCKKCKKGKYNSPSVDKKLIIEQSYIDRIEIELLISGNSKDTDIAYNLNYHIHGTPKNLYIQEGDIDTSVFTDKKIALDKLTYINVKVDIANTVGKLTKNKSRKKTIKYYAYSISQDLYPLDYDHKIKYEEEPEDNKECPNEENIN